jgi:hypothetical protein
LKALDWQEFETLFLVRPFPRLDLHVLEFTGLKDLPALLALDIFGVLIARHDLDLRMLALFGTDFLLGWLGGMARRHKASRTGGFEKGTVFMEIGRILRPPVQKVKSPVVDDHRAEVHALWSSTSALVLTVPEEGSRKCRLNRLIKETYS